MMIVRKLNKCLDTIANMSALLLVGLQYLEIVVYGAIFPFGRLVKHEG